MKRAKRDVGEHETHHRPRRARVPVPHSLSRLGWKGNDGVRTEAGARCAGEASKEVRRRRRPSGRPTSCRTPRLSSRPRLQLPGHSFPALRSRRESSRTLFCTGSSAWLLNGCWVSACSCSCALVLPLPSPAPLRRVTVAVLSRPSGIASSSSASPPSRAASCCLRWRHPREAFLEHFFFLLPFLLLEPNDRNTHAPVIVLTSFIPVWSLIVSL